MRISDWSSDVCSSDLTRLHSDGAKIDGDGVLAIFGAAADPQESRPDAAGLGVRIIADDPALEDHARKKQRRQRLAVEFRLAQIGGAHLADDRAFAEQIVEPLALDQDRKSTRLKSSH